MLKCASALVLSGTFDGIRFEPRAALHAGWYHVEATNVSCAGQPVHRLPKGNRWLFSHQPGLWHVPTLLGGGSGAVVPPQEASPENPWLNELMGSRRAAARGLRVGLIVLDWYAPVSSGGSLNAAGRALVAAAAAATVDEDGHESDSHSADRSHMGRCTE